MWTERTDGTKWTERTGRTDNGRASSHWLQLRPV